MLARSGAITDPCPVPVSLIDPVANQRVIPAKFLQQLDHLRCLLLAQERQLQDEMLAVLGELILTPLGG
jgi:hypothetical protein